MHLIFDRLTATIVGGIVVMMLFGLQTRIQSNTVESTIMYAAKKQTLSFAEVLERDLSNAGYLSTPGDEAILHHEEIAVSGKDLTKQFEFWGSNAAGARTRIRYTLDPTTVTTIDSGPVQLYQVTRDEYDGSYWQPSGASMATLTDFRVDLLDSANNGVTNRADARKLRVRFETAVVAGPTAASDGQHQKIFFRRLRWGVTLSPRGLSLQAFQG